MIKISVPLLPNKEKIKQSVDEIWESGQITNFGKYCQLFEEKIKKYIGCKYIVAVSNCDTALRMCSKCFVIDPSMPTFTFNSTYTSQNGRANLLDIDPDTLLVDLNTIEHKAKKGHRDFLLVNAFGNLYDIDNLNSLKQRYCLNIVFDSAHSFGSTYNKRKSGNLGYVECFSFSATKNITSGEGGAICTNDADLYEYLKHMRNYGFLNDYNSKYIGYNGKLSELNAVVGVHSLDLAEKTLLDKHKNVNYLKTNLKKKYKFQTITPNVISTHKDLILLDVDFKTVSKTLTKNNIQWKRYFLPIHMQTISPYITLPSAEKVYKNSICIPCHASLRPEELEFMCKVLLSA